MYKENGLDYEDPFAPEGEGDVNYRTLEWWQASMIMIAETISLGILSLPSVLATIGMVPGVILIVGLGILATYTGLLIGQFKIRYPGVHSMADAGEVLFQPLGMGRFGKELFGAAQTLYLIFSMASHLLTWTICLNTITNSATCTIVWSVVGLVVFWLFDLPRTLKKMSWLSIASFISIFVSVLMTMIDVGIEKPGKHTMKAVEHPTFQQAFNSVSNIVFAYAGHACYFGFMSEMKTPTDWPKAVTLLQTCEIALYVIASVVIYRFGGSEVKSPAIGSAGPMVMKVAWGLAIPTIVIAGVIYGHVAAKYIYVRIFRGTRHMTKRSALATGSWVGITLCSWVIAFVIAESIPQFNDLLALISALSVSWFSYGVAGIFWLFLNKGKWFSSIRNIFMFISSIFVIGIAFAICGIGLYTSGYSIHNASSNDAWVCKSNAQ
ncbi:amino acid transporter [Xylona heveae TC161]|uniref:Amino acid transporter n=1 Tax=Xylona heveae (strain CBS 132557 / TC161) TaxID=1328760 RepID=A0A165FX60_XYLHT|nr:amino acid transporter [Xylona heveae TC161]KZF21491.1 amino acid transporter [Xylona heveae TC161]